MDIGATFFKPFLMRHFRPVLSATVSRFSVFDTEWLCLVNDFSFYHGRILARLHFLKIEVIGLVDR